MSRSPEPYPASATVVMLASAAALASVIALLASRPNDIHQQPQETTTQQADPDEWPRDVCGIWRVAFTSHDGPPVAVPLGQTWLFDEQKKLLIWADSNNESAVAFKVVFSNGTHRQIDLIPWQEEKVALRAIYEISAEKMRVCGGPHGGDRPVEFNVQGANNHTTFLEHTFSPFGEPVAVDNQQ